MVVLAILVGGLIFFLMTGKQPIDVVPVSQLGKPTYLFSIYGDTKNGRLQKPLGVAVNEDNKTIYVADSLNARIAAFDMDGKFLFKFDKVGKKGKLRNPSYIEVNPIDGNVYVADPTFASIMIYNSKGKYVRTYVPNKNKKFPWVPLGMTFDDDANLYVADKGLSRVVKFDSQAKRLLSIGKHGQVLKKIKEKPGQLYFPNTVAVGSNGDVYVSDGNNQRVQIFDKKGKFKKILPVKGLPRGIALVEGGSSAGLYVVNTFDHQVQVFDKDGGNLLFKFGELGQGEGEFRYPNDLEIKGKRLYIVDRENSRIQVWRF